MAKNITFFSNSTANELIWQDWNDVYIVYQPSSTETHIFNDITCVILQALKKGALTLPEIAEQIVHDFNLGHEELSDDDLSFALGRLEELGLVEWSDQAVVI